MSEQTPVRPIHGPQRQLVSEDYERTAVAANAGLAGFRFSRSVNRPVQRVSTLGTLPHACVVLGAGHV
jgi:hypothetical protein